MEWGPPIPLLFNIIGSYQNSKKEEVIQTCPLVWVSVWLGSGERM